MARLSVELIPGPVWGDNLRRRLSRGQWNTCKRYAQDLSNGVCAVCGGVGARHPVECHERWEFVEDRTPHVLRLIGLVALCPSCHGAVHFGHSVQVGYGEQARDHLAAVNGWTRGQVEEHVTETMRAWRSRSERAWVVDLSWVTTTLGLELDRPHEPSHLSRESRLDAEGPENPFPGGTPEHDEHEMYMQRLAADD